MREILYYLAGKKTYILAIASAVNAYVVAVGIITPELGALWQTIMSILAGGAKYQTEVMGIKK